MSSKEIIGKLTPSHFENGENFDKKTFALLIDALLKSRSDAWKMPVIWLAGFLLALLFMRMGGFIGNILGVVCIFAGMIGGNLSVMGAAKQIKAASKELGIAKNEINDAIRRVKTELEQGVAGTPESQESSDYQIINKK